jgi:predicted metal-binding protein
MTEIKINPKEDLVFDLKVIEACRSCKRFGMKATCPPHILDREYYFKLLPSYTYGIICYEKFDATKESWEKVGKLSSLKMQKYLLKKRDELFFKGHYFVTAYGSGSCKICKECAFPCRHPNKSLVPLEATGVNVVAVMKKQGIDINFPVKNEIYRIGVLLYD